MRRVARSRRWTVLLLVAGFAALVMAWAYGSPLGTGPDESQHFDKALAAGHGEFFGTGVRPTSPDLTQVYWLSLTTRVFRTPGRLADRQKVPCMAFRPQQPAGCPAGRVADPKAAVASYVGTYQPFLSIPVGLVADQGRSSTEAFRLARLTGAVICLALIALGISAALVQLAPSEFAAPVAGLLVAMPPMAVFLFSVVNPNGPEIAAGVCFACGLVSVAGQPHARVGWTALVVGGAVLACARSLGPFWVAFGLLVIAADRGWPWLRGLPRRPVIRAVGVLAASVLLGGVWEATRQPHLSISVGTLVRDVPHALSQWPNMLRQTVGVFGWTDTRLPALAYFVGWSVAIAFGVAALVVGTPRERRVLIGAAAALLAFAILLSAGVLYREGWAMQARYVLPPAVLLPIYAAEVLRRHARGMSLARLVLPLAALLQLTAWLVNARRYAVGVRGPVDFLSDSRWHPVGGWAPYLLLAVAGSAMLVVAVRGSGPEHDDGGRVLLHSPAASPIESAVSS